MDDIGQVLNRLNHCATAKDSRIVAVLHPEESLMLMEHFTRLQNIVARVEDFRSNRWINFFTCFLLEAVFGKFVVSWH